MASGDSPDPRAAGAPPRRRPARKLLLAVGVGLATLVVAVALAEVALRVSGDRRTAVEDGLNRTHRRWAELLLADFYEELPDPIRRYAMRPGADATVDGWHFRANSYRARGPALATPKPAGEKRLLALGDSFCFGMWCDEGETLVDQLALRANAAEDAAGTGVTWRAVNMGVPGYHSGQQLRALEVDGVDVEPDVVVLYFNTNDILADGFFYDGELRVMYGDAMPLPATWRRRLWVSHFYGWLERRIEDRLTSVPYPHLSDSSPWSHNRPENQAACAEAVRGIASVCRERGIPLFVVNQPLMTWMGDARDPEWRVLPLVEYASRIFEGEDLPTFDVLGWMRGYRDGVDRGPEGVGPPHEFQLEQYFADENVQDYLTQLARGAAPTDVELPDNPDFHFNAAGYAELARLVYPRMRAEGMLP